MGGHSSGGLATAPKPQRHDGRDGSSPYRAGAIPGVGNVSALSQHPGRRQRQFLPGSLQRDQSLCQRHSGHADGNPFQWVVIRRVDWRQHRNHQRHDGRDGSAPDGAGVIPGVDNVSALGQHPRRRQRQCFPGSLQRDQSLRQRHSGHADGDAFQRLVIRWLDRRHHRHQRHHQRHDGRDGPAPDRAGVVPGVDHVSALGQHPGRRQRQCFPGSLQREQSLPQRYGLSR